MVIHSSLLSRSNSRQELLGFEITEDSGPLTFDLDSFRDKSYSTHNFHPFPAKFVPQIPAKLIRRVTQVGETVLDPFCGSGTTLVEAIIAGRPAIGLDVNPIACLASRTKTTPLIGTERAKVSNAIRSGECLLRELLLGETRRINSFHVPEFRNRDHWFQLHVQHELAAIRSLIYAETEPRVRDFLSTAFSAIIVRVSNQDSDTRWVAVEKPVAIGAALSNFIDKMREMLERISELAELKPAVSRVIEHSVTEKFPLLDASVDAVVTSPPYLNSFDYYLYHKLRMFWLGFDHYPIQSKELGSRNRHCDNQEGLETYTGGIELFFREATRCLKPGKALCVVIGDAVFRDRVIDMKDVYSQIAGGIGLRLDETFSFDQRKYTTAFSKNYKTHPKKTHILCFRTP